MARLVLLLEACGFGVYISCMTSFPRTKLLKIYSGSEEMFVRGFLVLIEPNYRPISTHDQYVYVTTVKNLTASWDPSMCCNWS